MKPTEAQIAERLPVWEALSEFFLDNELQPSDYERIAGVLAATNYTEDQLKDILIGEVYPVCRSNLLSVAGVWAGFDSGWLKENIGPRFGKRPKLRVWFMPVHRWMYAKHWNKVKLRVLELRSK